MKKKLLVLAMAGVMTASLLTACGSKETTTTTAATETTVADSATETAAASDDKAVTDYDKYLGWTNKEWAAADAEEKTTAAIVFSVYSAEALSGQTIDPETKALTIAEMRKTNQTDSVVSQLDKTWPEFAEKTLKEFADTGVEQMNTVVEDAASSVAADAETTAEADAKAETSVEAETIVEAETTKAN